MRATAVLSIVVLLLSAPSSALAVVVDDDGNERVVVQDPAFVTGDLWLDTNAAYRVEVHNRRCWYPQSWYDDVVMLDQDGEAVEYNTGSFYYDLVHNRLEDNADLFGEVPIYSALSCIQSAYVTRGDCSDNEQLAVLATSAVRDVHFGNTLSTGDFDIHDMGDLYCLVIITRDGLYERLEDEERVPEPIRATFPQTRTLVGLENSVWYEVADGLDATNGGFDMDIPTAGADYLLSLDIWLTGVEIDVDGDGEPEFTTSCTEPVACTGSLDAPLFSFEYETRAFHSFTIRTLWQGYAVDEVGTILTIPPGMMGNELTFDWETVEVRSSLDG